MRKIRIPNKDKNPDPRMAKVIITQYGGPDLIFIVFMV